MAADDVARELFDAALRDEQAVRLVPSDRDAQAVRSGVRALARAADVRIRTARMDHTVVVVLREAAVWQQDAATMRAKLTLGEGVQ